MIHILLFSFLLTSFMIFLFQNVLLILILSSAFIILVIFGRIICNDFASLFLSAVNKIHNQIASWDTKFDLGTKTVLLQPFSPVVIAADETERIKYVSLIIITCFYGFLIY